MSEQLISADELKALIDQTYAVENEYKELTQSFKNLEDTIENVVEFLPNAIWILEEDSRVFLQNSKAKELSKLLVTLKLDKNDYEVKYNNRFYLIKITTYRDKILLSATDITEQKRKENLATMGQMAAHLSHEIRNPIGSISLLSSALMKKVTIENKPTVLEIQKSVYRIERIIKATLMFSKGVTASKEIMKFSQLREALESAIEYYSFSKEIDFNLIEDEFELHGDLDLLAMMFSNFIFNAIDAIELNEEEEGTIRMLYSSDSTFHIFKIYDTGIAIEDKEKLFQAFESTKEKGNGLGLVLSSQIANVHGGDITLLDTKEKCFSIKILK
ncbi:MAG: GHKL domain-containing protein [Helicobacteraceae bacterium]|nr:GHKL domain-containing protein [Helicobacteraceae bacterium]